MPLLRAILAEAIRFEESSERFHRALKGRAGQSLRALAARLAKEKFRNGHLLRDLTDGEHAHDHFGDALGAAPGFAHLIAAPAPPDAADDLALLRLALAREEAARNRYAALAGAAPVGPIGDLFRLLAEEAAAGAAELTAAHERMAEDRALQAGGVTTIAARLNAVLHGGSPFDAFDPDTAPPDTQGWTVAMSAIDQILDQLRPALLIEVGTWKGTSAIHTLRRALGHRPDAGIICVDTWLGSAEHWLNSAWKPLLGSRHGRPRLYETFLANMIRAGLAEHVVPLPLPSDQAAMVLAGLKVTAPFIYIDAAHDEAAVARDIAAYWPLVDAGGVLAGDDYSAHFPGVMAAVARFLATAPDLAAHGTGDGKWYAQKKVAA